MGAGIGSAGARLGTGNLVSDFNWKVMAFRCQRRPEGSRRKLFPAYLAWMPDGLVNQIRTNGQALFHLLQFGSFGAGCFTGGQTAFPAELAGGLRVCWRRCDFGWSQSLRSASKAGKMDQSSSTSQDWTIEDEQCQRIGGGYEALKFRFLLFL